MITYNEAKELLRKLENNPGSNILEDLVIIENLVFSWINEKVKNNPEFWEEYKPEEGDWLCFYDSCYKNENIWVVIYKSENKPENDAANNKNLHKIINLKDIYNEKV